jgi:signal transduction histidine kinase
MLNAVSDLDASSVRFTQNRDGFLTLVGTKPVVRDGVATHVVRFHIDVTQARGALNMVYAEVMLVSLVAVLLSVIAVYYTTARLTKPFMEINDIVQKYSKGDYNVRIPISSVEEATQLAISFNNMADQLKDLEATRRSFVANVSHELRSPLTSMKGFLEAMQDGTIGPEEHEKYIGIVLSETKRMAGMVNDLLDLARIESGKTAIKLEIFDINELIRRTLITFEARIYEQHIEVDVKFAQEQYYVEADSAQISQVLRNIIDNAIKYSPDNSKLRIATYAMRREIYVSIQDSGPGIPEEDIPHVFDRFYKVEKAHTPSKQGGTGLGLSIVKRIIDQHNQTITLKSAKGKGSTFTFTLKRAPVPKRAPQDGGKKNGT